MVYDINDCGSKIIFHDGIFCTINKCESSKLSKIYVLLNNISIKKKKHFLRFSKQQFHIIVINYIFFYYFVTVLRVKQVHYIRHYMSEHDKGVATLLLFFIFWLMIKERQCLKHFSHWGNNDIAVYKNGKMPKDVLRYY